MTRDAGFTLIEMLVALALTSMIAVAGSTLLIGTVRASDRLGQTTEAVSSADLAHTLMRDDFANAISLAGQTERPGYTSGSFLALVRDGWSHPVPDDTHSSLLAIEYSFKDGALVRRAWLRPDPSAETPYVERVLAAGVDRMTTRYFNGRDWLPEWDGRSDDMPKAIELQLEYSDKDVLTQLFIMGGGG
ncbi:type II secretion system minor pseudopilin GspJ [Hyphomonas jannaschiana]|uniref:type II secretion system minor pseudopilin GspJ n=1 Tax=Hyphomonas jannaschiana TaxID=86 RepID=UPI0035C6AAA4